MTRHAFLFATLLALAACEDSESARYDVPFRRFSTPVAQTHADQEFAVYDPAEGVNKRIYDFNARLDKYFLLPVVDAYTYVTPEFAREGVSNFFLNVGEVTNFTNAVLQAHLLEAGTTLGRFAINTTVGVAGLFDVGTRIGLTRQPEDFGRTLGRWGAGSGPYIVLPVLGPSNLRDTVGWAVDYATLYFIIPTKVRDSTAYDIVAYGLQPINLRYINGFRYYSSGSPFEYELVRYIATQTREQQIEKLRQGDPAAAPK